VVNLSCSNGNPIPTLSAFGVISSVTFAGLPDPNWSWRFERDIKRVAKRRATFFKRSKYGVSPFTFGSYTLESVTSNKWYEVDHFLT
jgi:hypothetical protein